MSRTLLPSAETSVSPLLAELAAAYPALRFVAGTDDHWNAHGTIYYTPATSPCELLHELAHALLGHREYRFDIELLQMERAAWEHARRMLAPRHNVDITDTDVEDALDTYRAWLHNRSLCPGCGLSGLQKPDLTYLCVLCQTNWRANDAKTCALRRYRLPT